jgi:hypothetical protein
VKYSMLAIMRDVDSYSCVCVCNVLAGLSRAHGIDFSVAGHDSETDFDMEPLKNRIE